MRRSRQLIVALILLLAAAAASAQTVYITKSGSKYHLAGCRYLRRSAIAIDLVNAVARGFGPCSVRNPPMLSKSAPPGNSKASALRSEKSVIAGGSKMSLTNYKLILGTFNLIGKQPDGDSVRFIADDSEGPNPYKELYRGYRTKIYADRSVQLRFEGVDATEVHYGGGEQPLGREARDALLIMKMKYTKVTYKPNGIDVTDSDPRSMAGAILTNSIDPNGRPICFVYTGDLKNLKSGSPFALTPAQLKSSLNYWLLESGWAYYTVYSSLEEDLRNALKAAAASARQARKGVWEKDSTSSFVLESKEDISREKGQVILPKMFRRCWDYLRDVEKGAFTGDLKEWLVWKSQPPRNENDLVLIGGTTEVPLSELIFQANSKVQFQADLLDIVFIEK